MFFRGVSAENAGMHFGAAVTTSGWELCEINTKVLLLKVHEIRC